MRLRRMKIGLIDVGKSKTFSVGATTDSYSDRAKGLKTTRKEAIMRKESLYSSKRMDWSTPIDFYDALNKEFSFTLDPCADDTNHKCNKYYTEDQDGLRKDLSHERVFCNPPYGRAIRKWVEKCYEEVRYGNCDLAVMLIPARTDTRWFHDYIYNKAEIRFLKGRITFEGATQPAPFPSMVVIFRGKGGT